MSPERTAAAFDVRHLVQQSDIEHTIAYIMIVAPTSNELTGVTSDRSPVCVRSPAQPLLTNATLPGHRQ
jgi:hypothetical protein